VNGSQAHVWVCARRQRIRGGLTADAVSPRVGKCQWLWEGDDSPGPSGAAQPLRASPETNKAIRSAILIFMS